jgi:hypothetical protein
VDRLVKSNAWNVLLTDTPAVDLGFGPETVFQLLSERPPPPAAAAARSTNSGGAGDELRYVAPFQLVNHLPNAGALAHRAGLIRSLNRRYGLLAMAGGGSSSDGGASSPQQHVFDTIPVTYFIPAGPRTEADAPSLVQCLKRVAAAGHGVYDGLRMPPKHCRANVWVVKPAQPGRGGVPGDVVFVDDARALRTEVERRVGVDCVVQKVVESPLTVGGRKATLRLWALVTDAGDVYVHSYAHVMLAGRPYHTGATGGVDGVAAGPTMPPGAVAAAQLASHAGIAAGALAGAYSPVQHPPVMSVASLQAHLNATAPGRFPPDVLAALVVPRCTRVVVDAVAGAFAASQPPLSGFADAGHAPGAGAGSASAASAAASGHPRVGHRGRRCWELFGADFQLDDDLRPWLLGLEPNPVLTLPPGAQAPPDHASAVGALLGDVIRVAVDPLFPPPPGLVAALDERGLLRGGGGSRRRGGGGGGAGTGTARSASSSSSSASNGAGFVLTYPPPRGGGDAGAGAAPLPPTGPDALRAVMAVQPPRVRAAVGKLSLPHHLPTADDYDAHLQHGAAVRQQQQRQQSAGGGSSGSGSSVLEELDSMHAAYAAASPVRLGGSGRAGGGGGGSSSASGDDGVDDEPVPAFPPRDYACGFALVYRCGAAPDHESPGAVADAAALAGRVYRRLGLSVPGGSGGGTDGTQLLSPASARSRSGSAAAPAAPQPLLMAPSPTAAAAAGAGGGLTSLRHVDVTALAGVLALQRDVTADPPARCRSASSFPPWALLGPPLTGSYPALSWYEPTAMPLLGDGPTTTATAKTAAAGLARTGSSRSVLSLVGADQPDAGAAGSAAAVVRSDAVLVAGAPAPAAGGAGRFRPAVATPTPGSGSGGGGNAFLHLLSAPASSLAPPPPQPQQHHYRQQQHGYYDDEDDEPLPPPVVVPPVRLRGRPATSVATANSPRASSPRAATATSSSGLSQPPALPPPAHQHHQRASSTPAGAYATATATATTGSSMRDRLSHVRPRVDTGQVRTRPPAAPASASAAAASAARFTTTTGATPQAAKAGRITARPMGRSGFTATTATTTTPAAAAGAGGPRSVASGGGGSVAGPQEYSPPSVRSGSIVSGSGGGGGGQHRRRPAAVDGTPLSSADEVVAEAAAAVGIHTGGGAPRGRTVSRTGGGGDGLSGGNDDDDDRAAGQPAFMRGARAPSAAAAARSRSVAGAAAGRARSPRPSTATSAAAGRPPPAAAAGGRPSHAPSAAASAGARSRSAVRGGAPPRQPQPAPLAAAPSTAADAAKAEGLRKIAELTATLQALVARGKGAAATAGGGGAPPAEAAAPAAPAPAAAPANEFAAFTSLAAVGGRGGTGGGAPAARLVDTGRSGASGAAAAPHSARSHASGTASGSALPTADRDAPHAASSTRAYLTTATAPAAVAAAPAPALPPPQPLSSSLYHSQGPQQPYQFASSSSATGQQQLQPQAALPPSLAATIAGLAYGAAGVAAPAQPSGRDRAASIASAAAAPAPAAPTAVVVPPYLSGITSVTVRPVRSPPARVAFRTELPPATGGVWGASPAAAAAAAAPQQAPVPAPQPSSSSHLDRLALLTLDSMPSAATAGGAGRFSSLSALMGAVKGGGGGSGSGDAGADSAQAAAAALRAHPSLWVAVPAPGSGSGYYYYNSLSRETLWTAPTGPGVLVIPQAEIDRAAAAAAAAGVGR